MCLCCAPTSRDVSSISSMAQQLVTPGLLGSFHAHAFVNIKSPRRGLGIRVEAFPRNSLMSTTSRLTSLSRRTTIEPTVWSGQSPRKRTARRLLTEAEEEE